MADDRISLDFVGEQMLRMQADLRGVRSQQLRQESEQVEIRADLRRLEGKIDGLSASVDTRFASVDTRFAAVQTQAEQVHRTMATNLRIVLDAIAELKRG